MAIIVPNRGATRLAGRKIVPRLVAFNQVTLDGYFAGPGGDICWAHQAQPDAEWNEFVAGNANAGGVLLFGRVTYQMMASFWPTPAAIENLPTLARQMNGLPKIVFSRTLDGTSVASSWSNTGWPRETWWPKSAS